METEEEALEKIQAMKKQHYDATHNCWAYIIKDGAVRFSDDGEPGGTAGMPMLQVLQREGLHNIVCVVTRYFGGILLGAGGLVRAYTKGAKIAVDAAGKSMKRVWTVLYVPCPYTYYERVKLEVAAFGGVIRDTQFAAEVELEILMPEDGDIEFAISEDDFCECLYKAIDDEKLSRMVIKTWVEKNEIAKKELNDTLGVSRISPKVGVKSLLEIHGLCQEGE